MTLPAVQAEPLETERPARSQRAVISSPSTRTVPEAGIELDLVKITGLRGKGLMRWLRMPFMLMRAVWLARRLLEANLHNDADMLDEVAGLLRELKEAWDAIADEV